MNFAKSVLNTTEKYMIVKRVNDDKNSFYSDNALTLVVFYKDFQVETYTEEPQYTIEKLLSDLGGATGLFLGCR